MSKYLQEKAKASAVSHLTFVRVHQLSFGKIKAETEEEKKDIRSTFHSIGKTQFSKNHVEVIDYLNENLQEIVEIANNLSDETLQFELDTHNQFLKEKEENKLKSHYDCHLACAMFCDIFVLAKEDKLKVEEDYEIVNALHGRVKEIDYEYRILIKRLYARNINDKFYIKEKKKIAMKDIFKNKELIFT